MKINIFEGQVFLFKGNYTSWLKSKQKRLEIEEKHDMLRYYIFSFLIKFYSKEKNY